MVSKTCKPKYCPICGHFETEQFSFVERYKHNTNMTDFMIVEDFRTPTLSAAEIARRRNVSDTYAIYTFARYVDMDRLPLTEAISIDEVHLKISRYCNYSLVIQLIIRHILGYIRRRQWNIDERDRARHERIEQDIHRRFEFHHSRDYYIVKKYHWLITKNNSNIEYKQKPYYDARMGRYMTTQDYEEALFKIDPVFRKLLHRD